MNKRVFAHGIRVFAFMSSVLIGAHVGVTQAYANSACDTSISQRIAQENKTKTAFRQDAMRQVVTPPPAPSVIANTPCVSKELQRATDQFSNMPQQFLGSMTGSLGQMAGPASGIMNQFFESGVLSVNNAAESIPGMLNFQQLASDALSNLLGSLGMGSAFSNELCGMMVDMVVNFMQCQFPIELPEFPSLGSGFGSLNDLMPEGCAGNAMREAMYATQGAGTWDIFSQPSSLDSSGRLVAGDAQAQSAINRQRVGAD